MGLDPSFLSLGIETLSPEKTISWKEILQLGKGRRHDLLAGAPPLEHTIPKMTLTQLLQKVGANEAAVKKTGCVISVQATPPSLLL